MVFNQLHEARSLLQSCIESLQRLVPFKHFQSFLQERNLPTARSWSDLVDNIIRSCNEQEIAATTEAFLELYEEYRIWGKKVVFFFRGNRKMAYSLHDVYPLSTPYKRKYPLPLPEDTLRDLPEIPMLVAIRDVEDGVALVFCSPRQTLIKQELSPDSLLDTYVKQYRSSDGVFAIRKSVMQAYDVIYFPHTRGSIQVRLDCLRFKHIYSSERYLGNLLGALAALNNNGTPAFSLKAPMNIFPLVRKIYENPDEGRISEIAFECNTQACHYGNFRQVREDLRQEVYHQAGSKAVGAISPYLLAVAWDKDEKGNPIEAELLLPGNRKMLRNAMPLTKVFIPKSLSREAFDFVMHRIQRYL
jgi:hypothetical protein